MCHLMSDEEKILLLLQIIRINGNTEYLLRSEFTLSSISETIEELARQEIVRVTEKGINLTSQGEIYFHKLNRKLGRRGLYKYFNIDSVSKDIQYPIDAVYVPNKRVKNEE